MNCLKQWISAAPNGPQKKLPRALRTNKPLPLGLSSPFLLILETPLGSRLVTLGYRQHMLLSLALVGYRQHMLLRLALVGYRQHMLLRLALVGYRQRMMLRLALVGYRQRMMLRLAL